MIYSFRDILQKRDGKPFAWERKLRAPLPPPHFDFDKDTLILHVRLDGEDFNMDLSRAGNADGEIGYTAPDGSPYDAPEAWFEKHGLEVRDAVEDAACDVFWNWKHYRAGLFTNDPPDFDFWDAVKQGAVFDWKLGSIQWPNAKPLVRRPVGAFRLPEADDGEELIMDRWLCPGGAALLVGPTGIGKSSLAAQICLCWGLGRDCFGFEPVRPLSILVIQAENDAGDLREQQEGIAEGLMLTDDERRILGEMVSFVTVDDVCGPAFFPRLQELIRDWQPDLIVIDPLLSYVGGDLNRQEVAADFLRHRLNPLLRRSGIAALIVHHTGKPPRDPKFASSNADYSGLGSSELSNWARAILSLSVEETSFVLTLGKRGKRAGIEDKFGCPKIWLRYAVSGIFWQECEPEAASESTKKSKTADDLLAHVPASPGRILKNSLIQKGQASGIGENRGRAFLDELIDAARVYIHREKRPGTNPAVYIARHATSGLAAEKPSKNAENEPF